MSWTKKYNIRLVRDNPRNPSISLDQQLISPLTHLLINLHLSSKIQQSQGILLTLPSPRLPPLSLLTYIICKEFNSSVILYSLGKDHWETFYKLQDNGGYLWLRTPCSIYQREQMKYDPKIQKRRVKFDYYEGTDFKKLFYQLKNKILVVPRINKLLTNLPSKFIKGSNLCLIIENADRFIYNQETYTSFLNSCKRFKFIFLHFANQKQKYIELLIENLNLTPIHIDSSFIANNRFLQKRIGTHKKYISQQGLNEKEMDLISNINLETNLTSENETRIELDVPLSHNNINSHLISAISTFNNLIQIYDLRELNYLGYLPYLIINSFVPPDEYYKSFYDEDLEEYRTYDLKTIINKIYEKIINKINDGQKIDFYYALKELKIVMNNLSISKRMYQTVNNQISYNFESKFYRLFEILLNKTNDEQIIVAANDPTERSYLEKYFCLLKDVSVEKSEELLKMSKISFISFKKLRYQMNRDIFKSILILPGPIPPYLIEIFYYQWKKVLILNYEGYNNTQCKNMLQYYEVKVCEDEIQSIESLKIFGEDSELIKDFFKRCRPKEILVEDSIKESVPEQDVSDKNDLESVFNIDLSFLSKNNYLEHLNKNYTAQANAEQSIKRQFINKIVLKALRIFDGVDVILELNEDETYFGYDTNNKFVELVPSEFLHDYKILYLSPEAKESLFEEIKNLYLKNNKLQIEQELIDYWRILLNKKSHEFKTIKQFYNKYKEIKLEITNHVITSTSFNLWVKGGVSYFKDPNDMKAIGRLLDDDYIKRNYLEINLQGYLKHRLNIQLGRLMNRIIPFLNRESKINDLVSLSESEEMILNLLENNLFTIK